MIIIQKNLILFSTGCPKCEVLKKKLLKNGIVYKENNDVDTMVSLGISCVPVLSVDGTLMNFKQAVDWLNDCED